MALKVELKPNERIIIGGCVITNTDQRARLLIDGDNIPILREKDILTPATADTPAKLVYLAVQLMYISPDPQVNHGTYFSLVRDIVTAAPSAWPIIEGINNNILSGDLYRALKEARKLVAYEQKAAGSQCRPQQPGRRRRGATFRLTETPTSPVAATVRRPAPDCRRNATAAPRIQARQRSARRYRRYRCGD